MITAIFLGFLGLFLGIVGLRCVNIGSMELSRKAKLAATAGALHILAGNWGKGTGVPCIVEGGCGGSAPGVPCPLRLTTPWGGSPPAHPASLLLSPSLSYKSAHHQCFLRPH